jgi:antitoxin (DNA-binding transcriptional repressor) of toxin-antitoxin stability system
MLSTAFAELADDPYEATRAQRGIRLWRRRDGLVGFEGAMRPDERPAAGDVHCSTPCYSAEMAREVTQRELRNDSGEIMRQLDRGETFVVTRNGVPVGELTPLRRHRFVAAEAAIAMFSTAPRVDYGRFRADLDEIADQDSIPRG